MANSHNIFQLNILSNNVGSLRDRDKRRNYFQWLIVNSIDVACIQETFIALEIEKQVINDWGGCIVNALTNSSHSRGVSILFKKGLDFKKLSYYSSDDGRMALINIEYHDQLYTICNLYAPNSVRERNNFFARAENWILEYQYPNSILIMCGDMNTKLDDEYTHKCDTSISTLNSLLKKLTLKDIFMSINKGSQNRATYINK